MNQESKIKARRTKLNKCSKEELVERIIRKDKKVSKLITKNKELNKKFFDTSEVLNDTEEHYKNHIKLLNVKYDDVVKKNHSLQHGFKKMLYSILILAVLYVLTLLMVFIP